MGRVLKSELGAESRRIFDGVGFREASKGYRLRNELARLYTEWLGSLGGSRRSLEGVHPFSAGAELRELGMTLEFQFGIWNFEFSSILKFMLEIRLFVFLFFTYVTV